jgi:hypothetical protein
MSQESPVALVSTLARPQLGVFRGRDAVEVGLTRKQLLTLTKHGIVERILPDTYRVTSVAVTREQELRAALLWAGPEAAASGRSAGAIYELEGVGVDAPDIALPRHVRGKNDSVVVHRTERAAMMVRRVRGIPVTGVECTLLRLAAALDDGAFEIAFEDARRRRLTSIPAVTTYLDRFARPGRVGVRRMRAALAQLDPEHPARSTLEVRTRRLLVANGIRDFVHERATRRTSSPSSPRRARAADRHNVGTRRSTAFVESAGRDGRRPRPGPEGPVRRRRTGRDSGETGRGRRLERVPCGAGPARGRARADARA